MPFIGVGVTVLGFKRAFSPSSLPNLALWLKADAITGLTDGQSVATWNDSSGNGRNVTQATGVYQPTYKTNIINGKPVVRFDGSNDHLLQPVITGDPTALSLFVAAKRAASAGGQVLWGHRSESTRLIQLTTNDDTTAVWQLRGSGNALQQLLITGTLTNWNIYTATFDKPNNNHVFRLNGGSQQTNTYAFGSETMTSTLETIGASNTGGYGFYFNGDIAEIIVYSRALSTTERQQVEQYLAQKYAITLA